MSKAKADPNKTLSKTREITISVTGRKSGKTISLPIWFAHEPGKLLFLPVQGSQTNWYRNLRKNPQIQIKADTLKLAGKARLVEDKAKTNLVADMFRVKYGAGDVKKYYSNFDVNVEVPIT